MRDILKPTIVLFLICLIVAVALALTNYATRDAIAQQELLQEETARREVFSQAEQFEELMDLDSVLGPDDGERLVKKAYNSLSGGEVIGKVYSVESKGYGGVISVAVGIDNEGKTTGVKLVSHSETPGLGAKTQDEPFISQLVGITPQEELTVVKAGGTKDEEIDAVGGATISSKAVVKAVQAAIEADAKIKGGEF